MLRQLSSVPMLNPQPLPVLWLDGSDPAMIRALFERVAQLEASALVPKELYTIPETMLALGFKSRTTLWRETALGRIRQCSYGRYHISEINRYASDRLKEATNPKTKARK